MAFIAAMVGEGPMSAWKGEETMRSILILFLIILMTETKSGQEILSQAAKNFALCPAGPDYR